MLNNPKEVLLDEYCSNDKELCIIYDKILKVKTDVNKNINNTYKTGEFIVNGKHILCDKTIKDKFRFLKRRQGELKKILCESNNVLNKKILVESTFSKKNKNNKLSSVTDISTNYTNDNISEFKRKKQLSTRINKNTISYQLGYLMTKYGKNHESDSYKSQLLHTEEIPNTFGISGIERGNVFPRSTEVESKKMTKKKRKKKKEINNNDFEIIINKLKQKLKSC
jgi:hypothetical protein